MTFAMSTEGDSVKSALSEVNDKHATDNHTDSSQDSTDAKNVPVEKPTVNNIGGAEKEVEKATKEDTTEGEEGESDQESEASEKKGDGDAKKSEEKPREEENEKKPENDKEAVDKEEKDTKSEDDEGEEEEEEEVAKKEEKDSKEKKDVKEPKEKEEKASTASEKDEEEDEEAEGEEEEEEGSEEDTKTKKKGVPLLDQPLQTSGKRERKNVQRFEEDVSTKEPTKLEVEAGSGTPLGEIPRVEASITRFKTDDLKVLYKLLFKAPGKTNILKKNIKKFSGFPFKKDSEDYKKRVESCSKLEIKYLKSVCEMLDLQKTGAKGELVDRIMDFLLEPKDSGKPVGGGRPKRASAVRASNRGYSSHDDYSSDEKHSSRARRDKGKRPNLKDDSSSDEEFKPGDFSDASDEKPRTVNKRKRGRAKKGSSEEDEASLSAASSDESDDVPTSKRRKSITKATPKAKSKTPARGRGRPSRGTPAAAATTPRKSGRDRKPVRKHESSDEDEKVDDGSSSEDEPLVKKKAKTRVPPTDDEIKTYIKSILEGANLEEITMKTVCQRVYDNYPEFDLTARKNFIKSTVKSLIST